MKLPIYQIDAFTDTTFKGNPAAVVILDQWLDDHLLQAIASENNLAETAYVIPASQTEGVHQLRWFTPTREIDLCGHATLAAAYVLEHYLKINARQYRFAIHQFPGAQFEAAQVAVNKTDDLSFPYQLDFPERPAKPMELDQTQRSQLLACFGLSEASLLGQIGQSSRDLLVELVDSSALKTLKPDYQAIARLCEQLDCYAINLTAQIRDSQSSHSQSNTTIKSQIDINEAHECDFISRFFAPRAGIDEDPVTGSAHCTLTPFWAERLGKSTLLAEQASPRSGQLQCQMAGNRVLIGGNCAAYLAGEITI